jgi:CubicO group peptidase (beta-lactamase class C family)
MAPHISGDFTTVTPSASEGPGGTGGATASVSSPPVHQAPRYARGDRVPAVLALLLIANFSCRSSSNLHPTDAAARDIDRFVEQTLRDVPLAPSVAVAIVRNGKPYYARGFGYADVEKKRPSTAQTGYYIASSTKSFTGLACAILAERGQLDLDAPITRYLPEVQMAAPSTPRRSPCAAS